MSYNHLSRLSDDMYYMNGSILKLDSVYKLDNNYYTLMNVFYNDRNVGRLIYSFEFNDINFLSQNCNDTEYELINITLEHYDYFNKRRFQIPKLQDINLRTFLEYKYIDEYNKLNYNIKIKRLNNIYKEDEYVSAEIILNSSLLAIITTDKEFNNRLTFVKSFENNDIKNFNLNLIRLVLYSYNNNKMVHSDAKSRLITFNLFEDKNYCNRI
jgi:hypothetical protein